MSAYGTVTRSAPAGRRPPKPSHQTKSFMKKTIEDLPDAPEQRVLHYAGKERQGVLARDDYGQLLEQVHKLNACFIVLASSYRLRLEIRRTAACEELVARRSR